MGIDNEPTHLSPVEAITIDIIIVKVGLSPVAILIIANTMSRKLKGFTRATARRTIYLGGCSATKRLSPCSVKALVASSSVNPNRLEPG
jgi:hypothetical protein